ncbi:MULTISPECIES: DUF6893 family small protein [Streptomyces]|uniref:Uncharacterized protein n=1 Tax=Streptomyces noursei TaxID=1971 RepID=A0A059WIX6_STRNR|nr:hypothetical protein DC74_7332 [Streptomyces noursei]AKA09126.1 hypothetical protein SAZ_37970 [Streptomyces noursei ZPM]EPY92615.1 hypothetical protein K530_52345 [Streptomyces noursei CCRC 11814]GCB95493.1 hypothetical protein SALB_08298 [Streptomyces noursei]
MLKLALGGVLAAALALALRNLPDVRRYLRMRAM